jgi:putative CRISPR-associated protein (TIGR02620 family)
MSKIIVSRHPGALAWLLQECPDLADVPVLSEASVVDVRDKIVYGNLPLHLAAEADRVFAIEFSGAPPRGAEYGVDEMRAAGAHLEQYSVARVCDISLGDLDAMETSRMIHRSRTSIS